MQGIVVTILMVVTGTASWAMGYWRGYVKGYDRAADKVQSRMAAKLAANNEYGKFTADRETYEYRHGESIVTCAWCGDWPCTCGRTP